MERAIRLLFLLALAAAATGRASAQALKAASALEAVQAVPYLSTLAAAVAAANLTTALGPQFEGTLVAPQDSGFANLTRLMGLASPSDLLSPERASTLLQLLQFHVIPGPPVPVAQLQEGQKLPTLLQGQTLTASKLVPGLTHLFGGTLLNAATILGYQQIRGDKAAVWVTDQVLVPADIINATPQLAALFQPNLG